jgi:hypothetical protein
MNFLPKIFRESPNRKGPFTFEGTVLLLAVGLELSPQHLLKVLTATPEEKEAFLRIFSEINKVDDEIDFLEPEQILAKGAAWIGDEPCEFLRNVSPAFADYEGGFVTDADRLGVISRNDITRIANLFSCNIIEIANASIAAKEGKGNRATLAELNARTSQFSLATCKHCFEKDERVGQGDALTYEELTEIYPRLAAIGKIQQIYDDIEDFLKDVVRHTQQGVVSPNAVVCLLADRGISQEKACQSVVSLQLKHKVFSLSTIQNYDLRSAIQEVADEGIALSKQVGGLVGGIYQNAIQRFMTHEYEFGYPEKLVSREWAECESGNRRLEITDLPRGQDFWGIDYLRNLAWSMGENIRIVEKVTDGDRVFIETTPQIVSALQTQLLGEIARGNVR